MLTLPHGELLSECEILQEQVLAGAKPTDECADREPEPAEHSESYSRKRGEEISQTVDFTAGQSFGERQVIREFVAMKYCLGSGFTLRDCSSKLRL